jgi:hypothetical protein
MATVGGRFRTTRVRLGRHDETADGGFSPTGRRKRGWTWGTVTDLPANEGIGIVIHF